MLDERMEAPRPWGCVICGAPAIRGQRLCHAHLRLVAVQTFVVMGLLNDWELEDDTLPPLDLLDGVPTHRQLMTKARWSGQCPPWREQLAQWL